MSRVAWGDFSRFCGGSFTKFVFLVGVDCFHEHGCSNACGQEGETKIFNLKEHFSLCRLFALGLTPFSDIYFKFCSFVLCDSGIQNVRIRIASTYI